MKNKLLCVILCSYYSNQRIPKAYYKLKELFKSENIDFELIVMDDGSDDDSYNIALDLEGKEDNVRAFQLSRNYTSFYSVFAGLSLCNGDCATFIPDDEQLPYPLIVEMFRKWEDGEKSVFLHRSSRADKVLIKFFSNIFYSIMNRFSDITYPPGGTDSFLIDRELIDIINKKIHPINTSVITEVFRIGFNPCFIPYNRPGNNEGKSRWTFRKKLKYASDVFFSSSSFPIKFISFIGFFFSVLSSALIILYLYISIFGNKNFWGYYPPGWTSTVLFITFFSGLILLALGIIAEYIWRIYEEVKNRPGFIIKNKDKLPGDE